MSPTDELVPLLKKLRLSGVLQSLELRIAQAAQDNLAPAEFLLRLLTDEVERRDAKLLEQRIRWAQFEHSRTLEDFDFHFNPQLPKSRISSAGLVNLSSLRSWLPSPRAARSCLSMSCVVTNRTL